MRVGARCSGVGARCGLKTRRSCAIYWAGRSLQHPTRTRSGELAEPPLHAGILVTLVSLGFMLHAAKTGRFMPWFYIILFLPGIGAMAYVVVELLPEWFGSSRAQRARNNISTTLNPTGRYRQLRDELSVVDTIANRAALAEECLRLGKFEEALGQYDAILAKPLGDEPSFMLGKARAQFGLGQAAEAVATLEALKATWPNYQSSEEKLLLAMALEGAGRDAEALAHTRRPASTIPARSRECGAPNCCGGSGAPPRRAPSPRTSCATCGGRRPMCAGTSATGSRARSGSRADSDPASRSQQSRFAGSRSPGAIPLLARPRRDRSRPPENFRVSGLFKGLQAGKFPSPFPGERRIRRSRKAAAAPRGRLAVARGRPRPKPWRPRSPAGGTLGGRRPVPDLAVSKRRGMIWAHIGVHQTIPWF